MLMSLCLVDMLKKTEEFWSENKAKRANKHANKRIIYWPPFWNNIQLSPEGKVNSGGYILRQGIYPALFTDPEGDSCLSIYQIRWIKKCCFINGHNFFFWNFSETTHHFCLRSQNSEYPRIFQVTEASQNARKLLSTDLVNTKVY